MKVFELPRCSSYRDSAVPDIHKYFSWYNMVGPEYRLGSARVDNIGTYLYNTLPAVL